MDGAKALGGRSTEVVVEVHDVTALLSSRREIDLDLLSCMVVVRSYLRKVLTSNHPRLLHIHILGNYLCPFASVSNPR